MVIMAILEVMATAVPLWSCEQNLALGSPVLFMTITWACTALPILLPSLSIWLPCALPPPTSAASCQPQLILINSSSHCQGAPGQGSCWPFLRLAWPQGGLLKSQQLPCSAHLIFNIKKTVMVSWCHESGRGRLQTSEGQPKDRGEIGGWRELKRRCQGRRSISSLTNDGN